MAKLPVYRSPIFRGYTPENLADFLQAHSLGNEVLWRGLTSASRNPANAFFAPVLLKILPKSACALYPYAAEASEEEVLIGSARRFRVVSHSRFTSASLDDVTNRAYITVEEL